MKFSVLLLAVFSLILTLSAEVKIYKGNSTYTSDCIATYYRGRLYKGNSTYTSDCVATYKNNRIYKGNSTYTSDCVMTTSDYLHPALAAWLYYYYFRGAFF